MSTQDHSAHWHEHPNEEPHEHGTGVPPWKHDGVGALEDPAEAGPGDFICAPHCVPQHPPAGAHLGMGGN